MLYATPAQNNQATEQYRVRPLTAEVGSISGAGINVPVTDSSLTRLPQRLQIGPARAVGRPSRFPQVKPRLICAIDPPSSKLLDQAKF